MADGDAFDAFFHDEPLDDDSSKILANHHSPSHQFAIGSSSVDYTGMQLGISLPNITQSPLDVTSNSIFVNSSPSPLNSMVEGKCFQFKK